MSLLNLLTEPEPPPAPACVRCEQHESAIEVWGNAVCAGCWSDWHRDARVDALGAETLDLDLAATCARYSEVTAEWVREARNGQ